MNAIKRFFRKARDAFFRFMYGRNGHDRICTVLLFAYLALMIPLYLLLWLRGLNPSSVGLFLGYLGVLFLQYALLFYDLFRVFSKNVQKRRQEVDRFYGFFRNLKNRFRDRKTHVYRKCPSCRANIRLPKKKGSHTVCCPACRKRFDVKI